MDTNPATKGIIKMESQIQIKTNSLWDNAENIDQIRQLFAPNLTALEFQFFLGLGKATGLNPFAKEIWCVKYGSGAAQVFIGRDGYRRAALSHPDYDYHQCDTVYDNDSFEVVNGEIRHTYNLKDRGKIVGAYCITKRLKASRAVYVFVKFSEYNTGKSLWATKPDVMCRKVAEATGLRAAFQDLLGGTYTPEEMPESDSVQKDFNHHKGSNDSHIHLARKDSDNDARSDYIDNSENNKMDSILIDSEMEKALVDLICIKDFSLDRVQKALKYYNVSEIKSLTKEKYKHFFSKVASI